MDLKIGSIVYSKLGRDFDKPYVIIGNAPKGYVWLANGKNKCVENPKLKNPKHLRYKGEFIAEVQVLLEQGKLQDSYLVHILSSY